MILIGFLRNFTLAILIAAWPAFAGGQGALEKRTCMSQSGEKPRCTTCASHRRATGLLQGGRF